MAPQNTICSTSHAGSMLSSVAVLALLLLTIATTHFQFCEAYVFMRPPSSSSLSAAPQRSAVFIAAPTTALFSEPAGDNNSDGGEWQKTEEEEIKAEEEQEEGEEIAAADAEEEEEEEQEDPEVTALKEAISDLEGTLKEKKSTIQYLKDQAEQYSKGGYARKVAEMETMRRMRSSAASSNKEASIAGVLQEFLPVVDTLDMLKEKYGDDDFGKQYVALAGNMHTAFSQMGVTEYQVAPGETIDRSRVLAVEEVHSADHPKDTVIEPLKPGMELKGNVVRFAECVASLGEEGADEEEETEEDAADEEGEDESAEEQD